MGRWVTSKGRRIYIPDEGEENPFAKKKDEGWTSKDRQRENSKISDFRKQNPPKTFKNPSELPNKIGADEEYVLRRLDKNTGEFVEYEGKGTFGSANIDDVATMQGTISHGYKTTSAVKKAFEDRNGRLDNYEILLTKKAPGRSKEESIPGIKEWARNQDKIRKENEALREEIKANREESIKQKQIASNKAQADERNNKIKPYYVDQETQIMGEKMSSRGKMIYAKSEEEALSQYKKDYPKGNARIKESKYPEHIKKAQELNKSQANERNNKANDKEISSQVFSLSKELNKNGTAVTTNKKIADMYKENKNPNFNFTVTKKGNEYTITAKKAQANKRNGKKDTWHSETPDERKEFLRRKEVAHSLGLRNDVLGQLATDRYTPEGLKDAVERGWITQKQADKINGKKKRKGSK